MIASVSYSVHFSLPFLMTPLPLHPDFAMTHPVGQRLLRVCSQQIIPPLCATQKPCPGRTLPDGVTLSLPREEQTRFQGSLTPKMGLIPW